MLKLGILISGRGSNMQAIIDACGEPDFPARIVLVLSNRPEAGGLKRAAEAGIPIAVVDHKAYASRSDFETAMSEHLAAAGADLVVCAGFMRVLTATFLDRWRDRAINIHPSLLPSFRGTHVHEQALAAGVKISGCTVHVVRADVDAGPILGQAAVPVLPGDTPDSLAARILKAEHALYPLCIRGLGEGWLRLDGDRVIDTRPAPEAAQAPLIVP